jgi:hypothetical protein
LESTTRLAFQFGLKQAFAGDVEVVAVYQRDSSLHEGTSINSFSGRIAVSHARAFLVYRFDMPRHSLRGSLRFIPQK